MSWGKAHVSACAGWAGEIRKSCFEQLEVGGFRQAVRGRVRIFTWARIVRFSDEADRR